MKSKYLNELLLVSRISYSLLNRANHMKVEAHMAPPPTPPSSHHSQFPTPNLSTVKINESYITK